MAKVIVHITYSTKHRKPWLNDPDLRSPLYAYNATILKEEVDSPAILINGVEDHVVATFDYGYMIATLGTSFRARLPNRAYVIGDRGYIVLPNFWCAGECQLWIGDDMTDRFEDGRKTNGFDYQI